MTAYTSTASGNWNAAATWVGNSGFPTTGDTATIAAGHTITVPTATTSTCGAVTFTAGADTSHRTTLTVNGTFNMGGAFTLAANNAIIMGAGAVFDLNANTLTAAGDTVYNFTGTAGSHVTIQNTGALGTWQYTSGTIVCTWIYVDVTGPMYAEFARGNGNAGIQSFQYCTFTNMRYVALEDVNTTADSGILVDHCDFRNPNRANTADMQPFISMNSNEIGANIRQISNCTWYSSGNVGYFRISARGATFRNNVVVNYRSGAFTTGSTQTWQDSFFSYSVGDLFSSAIGYNSINTFQRNYCYYTGGDHPFANFMPTGSSVLNSVFECPFAGGASEGVNWFLDSNSTLTVTFTNNIVIGEGEFLTTTGACTWTVTVSRCTFYTNNLGAIETAAKPFGCILGSEQVGLISGSPNFYNNLVLEPDKNNSPRDACIALLDATANQLGVVDYNVCWSYDSQTRLGIRQAGATPNYYYQTTTAGTTGLHDFGVDPKLNGDPKTLNLAGFDKVCGGPGTGANAMTEMLKMNGTGGTWNPKYDTVSLVNWIQRGFTARNSALIGTGYQGGNIGAFVAPPSGNAPDRLRLGAS